MNYHDEGTFAGAGGVEIFWQAWSADVPTRAVIVLAHGASEHSGRYVHVAEHLTALGFPFHALDHRGHGRSQGKRSRIDRFDDAIADLDTFVERARSDHPGAPLILLGHSMGGCVAIEYALRHQAKLDSLILSSPVAVLDAATPVVRAIAKVLSAVLPGLPLFDVDADAISRDPAEVAAYDTDPLVYRGKLPVRTVAQLSAVIATFPERIPSLTLPLLVIHGDADRIVPVAGGQMVHDRAGSQDKTIHVYEGHYHELFNEPQADRERVLADVADWLTAHYAPAIAA